MSIIRSCYQRAVADRSAISRRSVGERSIIGWRLFLGRMCTITKKVHDCLETSRQPIGDQSATSRRLKTVLGFSATTATGRRPVTNQSPNSPRPLCDHQKPFYDRFGSREVSLAASKSSLRPNRPCDHTETPATCRWPVGDLLATAFNLPATARNNGRKEVAHQLQAMCDRGLSRETVLLIVTHPGNIIIGMMRLINLRQLQIMLPCVYN